MLIAPNTVKDEKGVAGRVRHTSIVIEVGVVTLEETFSLRGLCLD